MSAHSPLPWTTSIALIDDDTRRPFASIKSEGSDIIYVSLEPWRVEANAALICRAVNAHAELVAALRDIANSAKYTTGEGHAACAARAAVALAKLEQPS